MTDHPTATPQPDGLWQRSLRALRQGLNTLETRLFALLVLTGLLAMLINLAVARAYDAPFLWLFWDMPLMLGLAYLYWLILTFLNDGVLVVAGAVRAVRLGLPIPENWKYYARRHGFARRGVWYSLFLLVGVYFLMGTANVTNLSITLLSRGITTWQDTFFWNLEEPVWLWLLAHPIPVDFFEFFYHMCWGVSVTVAFVLAAYARSSRLFAAFIIGYILVFYIGRGIGVLCPVLGPGFYREELFGYLNESVSGYLMELIAEVAKNTDSAAGRSGMLIGGVCAMPSLHAAMSAWAAYMLYRAYPRTVWLTAPWLVIIILTTILLGWHYIADVVGGFAVAALVAVIMHPLIRPALQARRTASGAASGGGVAGAPQ